MDVNRLRELLAQVSAGTVSAEKALELLRSLPFEDLGFAKVDHHRSLRTGFPEVIFGSGKTADQIIEIARRLNDKAQNVLITRLGRAEAEQVRLAFPEMSYSEHARVGTIVHSLPEIVGRGLVLVVAAGTSDVPVAEEAALTAELLGNTTERLYDVGISGIHRLFAHRDKLRQAAVLVVVAGMEGALPSVVAGLVDRPVIAVPTSIGYGASFGGLAALLAMLNSCAAGVLVVNIDNGFGAAVAASLINRRDS
ncbi:MAG: nickel pincer cofactor biosynthesis protein LarB [Candidatus Binatia bacterium]|jgi:pyridinium-3,5-biscarboxylic acid mononucleotide synthase